MMNRFSHTFTLWLCTFLPLGGLAQDRARLIDSLAHPQVSETGAAMRFAGTTLDIGSIREDGGTREYEFSWINIGEAPVSITKVTTTCGCAVPSFDRTPVAQGDTSSLTVAYHPKGHPGKFSRRIFVYTGSSGKLPAAILTLKGYVEPAAVPVWQYGCRMGNLILKRDEVKFTEGQKAVERIQCMNAGDSPLTVGAETALLPPYIGFRCEPETIAPGEKADLVITYDPDACGTRLLKAVPLVLTGPELPPSQRTVRVLLRDASAR